MQTFFVSSTFKDMQQERDILHDVVLPEITEFAKKYGKTVDFSDLRWGVDSSDMDERRSAAHVLQVCFDEIDRAEPFMIVLLGDRYGWIPDKEIVGLSLEQQGRMIQEYEEKSVTELEILYGILKSQKDVKCRFYFRNIAASPLVRMMHKKKFEVYSAESHEDEVRMNRLKNEIQTRFPNAVKQYTASLDTKNGRLIGMEAFAAMVEQDIKQMLIEAWGQPKTLSPMEQQENQYWFAMESDLYDIPAEGVMAYGKPGAMASLLKASWLAQKQNWWLVSANTYNLNRLMGTIACRYREIGVKVIPYDCTQSLYAGDVSNMMDYLSWKLSEFSGVTVPEADSLPDKIRRFHQCLQNFEEKSSKSLFKSKIKLVIIIRGLEELNDEDIFKWFPKETFKHINFIISGTKLQDGSTQFQQLTEVTYFKEGRVFTPHAWVDIYMKKHHKQLDGMTKKVLVEKNGIKPELYLELLMQRLLLLNENDFIQIQKNGDGMQAISRYLCTLTANQPNSLDEMCQIMIERAEQEAGALFADAVIDILCAVPYGISLEHLQKILETNGIRWNHLNYTILMRILGFMISETLDGQLKMNQPVVKEMVCEWRKMSIEKWTRAVYSYMMSLKENDLFLQNQCMMIAFKSQDGEGLWRCFTMLKKDRSSLLLAFRKLMGNAEGRKWLAWNMYVLREKMSTSRDGQTSIDGLDIYQMMNWCVASLYPYLKEHECESIEWVNIWDELKSSADEIYKKNCMHKWNEIYFKTLFQIGEILKRMNHPKASAYLEYAKRIAKEDFHKWPNHIYKKLNGIPLTPGEDSDVTLAYGTEMQDVMMETSYSDYVRIIDQYLGDIYQKTGQTEKARELLEASQKLTKMLDPNPENKDKVQLNEWATLYSPDYFDEKKGEEKPKKKQPYKPDYRRNTAIQHSKTAMTLKQQNEIDKALDEYEKSNEILQEIYSDGETGEYYDFNGVSGNLDEIRIRLQTECLRDMGLNYRSIAELQMAKGENEKSFAALDQMYGVGEKFDQERNSRESKMDMEDNAYTAARLYYIAKCPKECFQSCDKYLRYRGEAARKGEPVDNYVREHREAINSMLYQTVIVNPHFGPECYKIFVRECNAATMGQDFETYVNLILLICDLTEWMWEQKLDWRSENVAAEDVYMQTVGNLCDLWAKHGRWKDFEFFANRVEKEAQMNLKQAANINMAARILNLRKELREKGVLK